MKKLLIFICFCLFNIAGDAQVKLYGMTNGGGINGYGVIFEWDPSSNTYTKKIDLDRFNGGYPQGSLSLYNSKFYGTTAMGGVNQFVDFLRHS